MSTCDMSNDQVFNDISIEVEKMRLCATDKIGMGGRAKGEMGVAYVPTCS